VSAATEGARIHRCAPGAVPRGSGKPPYTPEDRIRCLRSIRRRVRTPRHTLLQGIYPRAASRRASPTYLPPGGIRRLHGVYPRRHSVQYHYVETACLLGGSCSTVYGRIHVHSALRRHRVVAAPTVPTPHRERRPDGAWNREEDFVKRTFGCMPTRGLRQRRGVMAAHPYTPMGGGGA
jgi:hypothetical protein